MTSEAPGPAPAPCPGCGKPPALCVCPALRPIETRTFVLVLQHPQEKSRELGTAGLVTRIFPRSALKVGLSWPGLKRALGREVEMKRWAVLYLGPAKLEAAKPQASKPDPGRSQSPEAPEDTLLALDRKGAPIAGQGALAGIEGLIVLDGNWAQAKTLWWRNPWLLKTRRLVLRPAAGSLYGPLRREPRAESLSTLEAVAESLACLEGRPEIADEALAPFRLLLEKYRHRGEVQT